MTNYRAVCPTVKDNLFCEKSATDYGVFEEVEPVEKDVIITPILRKVLRKRLIIKSKPREKQRVKWKLLSACLTMK